MSSALSGGDGSGLNAASLGAMQSGSTGPSRDNRWLTLEVCREFQRSKCSRTEQECKYAHPPAHVEVQNGRVTCCFDSIKGKCNRKDPPCKYLHPPAHLKEQLLQNGRNNLVARNMMMQQMQLLQQLSANPAAAAGNVPVMYQSSNSLTSAQQAVLTPTSSLYPSAYLGAATLNGSPSPTGVASSTSDVSNAFQSALLNANAQQTAANSAASNQLIAALLGQLAAGNASSTAAAGLTAQQQQQQQQYRALQLALLQAAQQKQVFAATGYSNVAPTASSPTLLSGGSLSGLQGGASLSGMTLTGLQPGLGTLQNGGLTALQASLNGGASQQSANGVNDASVNANSANALLQSLSTYGSNGTQQRNSAEWATLNQLDFRSQR